ncbi:Toxin 1, PIN domain [Serinicoccus hydrothermalis]|uniref:Ribonuclease VapC n=1 Tax=Serinicoccus hydrothermalis TaxID=1758689 RepID=A0A1B1NC70_9MICO|nr:type II toxin-antitoxin system VapC family toxin [Serinicoccus hydrothermalis]ANS79050.1 Toxin 1, PIN domain [Serinicoccus hydrothermalis]
MLVVDTNVLVYAAHVGSAHHAVTARWLEDTVKGPQVLAVPWVAALGFLRITTNPRVFAEPFTTDEALTALDAWLAHPGVTVPQPTTRHPQVLAGLLRESGTAGNLTTDAHIAALAVEHGAEVATFDRDFARFGVRVVVPGEG